MKYHGKISFTMDKQHPDIECVENWEEDKIFTFEDRYSFDDDYTEEEATVYIKRDLNLVAGGGYDTDHIHNVKFEIKKVQ